MAKKAKRKATIAVLTGIFSKKELAAVHPDLILDDVSKLLGYLPPEKIEK